CDSPRRPVATPRRRRGTDRPPHPGPARATTRLGRRMFAQIDHVGVAVDDLDAAIALHEQTYGLALAHREVVEEQGVEAVLLDVGASHVELLRPLQPDTAVGRFLASR